MVWTCVGLSQPIKQHEPAYRVLLSSRLCLIYTVHTLSRLGIDTKFVLGSCSA